MICENCGNEIRSALDENGKLYCLSCNSYFSPYSEYKMLKWDKQEPDWLSKFKKDIEEALRKFK